MQALSCCGYQKAPRDRDNSTPATQLSARPAQAKLSKSALRCQSQSTSAVPLGRTQAPSLIVTPRDQATLDLTVLEVEDSDSEDEHANARGSPTSTLGALKTRLIRRLSQKSQSKRNSQQSVIRNEEELARRAELRRLRQKRIQEELETEEEEDGKEQEIKYHRPMITQHVSKSPSPSALPKILGGGPRDNVEFSICELDDGHSNCSSISAQEMVALAMPIIANTSTSLRRRSTCPNATFHSKDSFNLETGGTLRESGSMPQLPSLSQLESIYSSHMRHSNSITSWQLSYSAGQLAEYIINAESEIQNEGSATKSTSDPHQLAVTRIPPSGSASSTVHKKSCPYSSYYLQTGERVRSGGLSIDETDATKSLAQGSDNDDTHFEQSSSIFLNTTQLDKMSPLDLWLRISNTLQSTSHSPTRRNSDSVVESRPDAHALGERDFNGKYQEVRPISTNPGHEFIVLKIPGSFPTPSGSSAVPSPEVSITETSKTHAEFPLDVNHRTAVQEPAPVCFVTGPSNGCFTQSASNLSLIKRLEKNQALMFNKVLDPKGMVYVEKSETTSYKTAPVQTTTLENVNEGEENFRQHIDSTSVPETKSFKHIEAELNSAAKRFAKHVVRRHASSPAVSRFREGLNNQSVPPYRTPSILARLLPKKWKSGSTLFKPDVFPRDHRNCVGDAIAASHLVAMGPNAMITPLKRERYSSRDKNLKLEETTTDLWRRAIRLQGNRCDVRHQEKLSLRHDPQNFEIEFPPSVDVLNNYDPIIPSHNRETSSVYSRSNYDIRSPIHSPKSRSIVDHEDIHMANSSLETSNRILKDWQHHIQSEVHNAHQATSSETHICVSRGSHDMPESWAKWSSHDRVERNGATSIDDLVVPKDFAVVGTTLSDNTQKWTDKERDNKALENELLLLKRPSLSTKFGRSLRNGLAKMLPSSDSSLGIVGTPREVQQKRVVSAKYLEYPELELLPNHGGYQELEALERTIDYMKRSSIANDTRPLRLHGAPSRPPLSLRLAHEIQSLHHNIRTDSHDSNESRGIQPSSTPVSKRNEPRSLSAMSQQPGTPLAHLSYDDCVPTYMLDGNGSIKSDNTLIICRSKSAIERKVSRPRHEHNAWNDRAKSVSLRRMRACGSELEKLIAAERTKN